MSVISITPTFRLDDGFAQIQYVRFYSAFTYLLRFDFLSRQPQEVSYK